MKKRSDQETTISELKDLVEKFIKDRNWQQHHTPQNIATNISIEAAELMEQFQWDKNNRPDAEAISDELADVIFNCLNFANINQIDISSAFVRKYQKLEKKYPLEVFNAGNDSLDDYHRIKKAYRSKKK